MNRLLAIDKPPTCAGEWLMPPGSDFDPPHIHDTSDDDYWRGITVDQLLAAVSEQIPPERNGENVDDDYARAVILDAVHTITEDTMDRALDMTRCNKVDECRAKAVFLAWLSWNLDHEMLPEGVR